MAGRDLPAVELDQGARPELTSLASRRNTAQALALRARIILACAEGGQNKVIAERVGWIGRRSASGGDGLWRGGWKACTTIPDPGPHN